MKVRLVEIIQQIHSHKWLRGRWTFRYLLNVNSHCVCLFPPKEPSRAQQICRFFGLLSRLLSTHRIVPSENGSASCLPDRQFLFWFSQRRGEPLRLSRLRIPHLTRESTPSVTDVSHGLHMLEPQYDYDTPPHTNSQ